MAGPPHPSSQSGRRAKLQTRPRFKNFREFELTPTDMDRFSAALREAYPTIRLLRSDFEEHWIERKFGDHEVPGFGPNYREIISESMRPPHDDPMPYAQSLKDLGSGWIVIWVEQPGWRPQWSRKPYRRSRFVLLNEPDLHFRFMRSMYIVEGPEGTRQYRQDAPKTLGDDEICYLGGGRMYGPYFADDLEQQEFLKRVWRIARSVTTNKLARVDLQTLEFRFVPKAVSLRAGLDAADWTRRDRRHLIGYNIGYRAVDAFPPLAANWQIRNAP